jgi:hypothetical protein
MEVIVKGVSPKDNGQLNVAGSCTEEPGDNCWIQLD